MTPEGREIASEQSATDEYLTAVPRRRHLRKRRRIVQLGGAVVAAAGATLAAATLVGSDSATTPRGENAQLAAWTVVKQPSGLVVVTVNQLRDPAGL